MCLAMTSEEICRHYRLAANKSEDIVVLADLNMTSRDVIREILKRSGENVAPTKKTSRVYGTNRGPEIEKRLRKGQSIDHIARNMDIKRETVEKWIQENGLEGLVQKTEDDPVSQEEELRRAEEKRKRPAWEMRKARSEAQQSREENPDRERKDQMEAVRVEERRVEDRMEAILGAMPDTATMETRKLARDLCMSIAWGWLTERLGLPKPNESKGGTNNDK